jgi:hydroxymethylglutaryl-CoA reductase
MPKSITGFSKLSKEEKINWVAKTYFSKPSEAISLLKKYSNSDSKLQQLHDEFIENTIANFYLPLGIAPNFLINERNYTLPMVIEESSVVAAASNAAKFWATRGGFKTTVLNTEKIGQVHFIYKGDFSKLEKFFIATQSKFLAYIKILTFAVSAD